MTRFFLISLLLILASAAAGQAPIPISAVQGEGDYSPMADSVVIIRGIVTAVRIRGFYVQTEDELVDDNPKTSEGIYVSTSEAPDDRVSAGDLVEVKGMVAERRPNDDPYSLYLTQIINPDFIIVSEDGKLPEPALVSGESLKPDGPLDQLERFEGMRVRIDELTVVAPTGGFFDSNSGTTRSDGVFFGILPELPRPFREPGLEISKIRADGLPETVPGFDMNPELIRVESLSILGARPIDVTSGAALRNIVGVIDYDFRSYTLLVEPGSGHSAENNRQFIPAEPAGERELSIASLNLENFFDDEENSSLAIPETKVSSERFEKRLTKASLAIRNVMMMPDIIGIIEIENLEALRKLANRINRDAAQTGMPDPGYGAVLRESNDPRGIDVGFLVKTRKLRVVTVEQLGKNEKLGLPDTEETLFSRPPLLAKFEKVDDVSGASFSFTVIVNHFKSYRGIEDPADGFRVRTKRQKQAEFLAGFVVARQNQFPAERLILIGDFNSYQFNDGYNDLIGTLTGNPDKNVIAFSDTVYETGLVNLIDYVLPDNRYSYIYAGSAQALDHVLINKPARQHARRFGYARFNADFPKVFENDETRPERLSDHDVPVLYLSVDGRNERAESAEVRSVIPAETSNPAVLTTYLFYSFDRKEPEPAETSAADAGTWIDIKTADIILSGKANGDLFEHNGGGPNGAEWNPAGDLYLLISAPSTLAGSEPELRLNGSTFSGFDIISKSSGDSADAFYWIRIPAGVWNNQLKDIEESDYSGLFGDKPTPAPDKTEIPLNTGRIIKFEIKFGDRTATKYLHVDFGG